jgi:AbrB family looped-hinge helix DNA binding protein
MSTFGYRSLTPVFSYYAGLLPSFVELVTISIIQEKGQMTLPKERRALLEIEEGDQGLLKVEPDRKIIPEKAIIVYASNNNEWTYN